MNFKIDNHQKKLEGQMFYLINEYSFDYEPNRNVDVLVMIKSLILGFDSENMQAQQIFGYHPNGNWINKKLKQPKALSGELILDNSVEPGLPKRLPGTENWNTYYDKKTGWICIGECDLDYDYIAVEFDKNCIAVLSESKMKSLWMNPVFKENK